MTRNGRISMAGLNEQNVKYVAEATQGAVTREIPKSRVDRLRKGVVHL